MTGEETRSACCAGYKAYYHHEKGYPSKDFFGAFQVPFIAVLRVVPDVVLKIEESILQTGRKEHFPERSER